MKEHITYIVVEHTTIPLSERVIMSFFAAGGVKYFTVSNLLAPYNYAKTHCSSNGGTLAVVANQAEEQQLWGMIG